MNSNLQLAFSFHELLVILTFKRLLDDLEGSKYMRSKYRSFPAL